MKKLSKLAFIMSLVVFVMVGFINPVMADNMPEDLEGEVQENVVEDKKEEPVDLAPQDPVEEETEDKAEQEEPIDIEESEEIPVEEDADLELEEPVEEIEDEDQHKEPIDIEGEVEDKTEPTEDINVTDELENKKLEEIEEVEKLAPLSEEAHDYNFDIWIVEAPPLKKIEPANNKKVILKDRGDGVYSWETLMLIGYYNDNSEKEQFVYGNNLVCEVIAEEGVASWTSMTSRLTIKDTGKITLKFTTPNHEFLAPETDPYIVTINVVGEDEELNEKFDINIDSPLSISAGEDLNIRATATNGSKETKNALLIVGLYDKSNTMMTYAYSEKEVKAGETIDLGAGFKLPETSSGYNVKVFVWDSWESKNPISDMTELEVK